MTNTTTDQTNPWDLIPTSDLVGGRRPPVVFAEASDDGRTCRFFCRYCDRHHIHGYGEGHRVAHCLADDSPYRVTGYIVRIVEQAPPLPRVRRKIYMGKGRPEPYLSGLVRLQRRQMAERSR